MYSINVFLTFTLSQLGMVLHWLKVKGPGWIHGFFVNVTGMVLTFGILIMTSVIKFGEGGWVTILVTGAFIAACVTIHRHYDKTLVALRNLDQVLENVPFSDAAAVPQKQPLAPTAILMVSGYNGIGIHSILGIQRFFPGHFKNFVFLSSGIIDSGRFKGRAEIDALLQSVELDLSKYVKLANKLGFYAESRAGLGIDVITELDLLCQQVADEWEKKVYFMGQLAFEGETFWTKLLHNQTSFALQRKLLFNGMEAVILPIRLRLEGE
jgi:hypothetical protein